MAVYECSMFFNENDLLEVKLNEHWDIVDKFVIVEAGETHTGIPKPFNFDHERFKPYSEKLVYVKFDSFAEEMAKFPRYDCPIGKGCHANEFIDDWARDHFQFNYTAKVLEDLGADDFDLVLYSCLDEIIKPDAFQRALKLFENKDEVFYGYSIWNSDKSSPLYQDMRPLVHFRTYFYAYKINLLRFGGIAECCAGSLTEFINYKSLLPATMRSLGLYTHEDIPDGSWHFTFLDDTDGERVLKKMKSWAHSRDNYHGRRRYDLEDTQSALQWILDEYELEIPRDVVPILEGTHPTYMVNNLEKFEKYILKV